MAFLQAKGSQFLVVSFVEQGRIAGIPQGRLVTQVWVPQQPPG